MNSCNLKPLPLGSSDFASLRECNQIYVDKTKLIFEIASQRQKFFLSRPRRFGKSLLISTFESLFKYGLRDFKELAIEKLWKDTGTYKVVRLDFSEAKNFQDFDEFSLLFKGILLAAFKPHGFSFDPCAVETICTQLSVWFKTIPLNSLVLLIDEYDAPLTACLNDTELFKKIRKELSGFYATIKSNDGAVRFFFMTGITKFNKTSIFSELNNFSDLTLDVDYGTLLGYTHDEVEQYFGAYLDRASELLNKPRKELLSELTNRYDGFCFERSATQHVFSPWSLLKFLSSPRNGLIDYWFESGGRPSALLEYLKSHSLRAPEEYGKEKSLALSTLTASSDSKAISDLALLTQAGYLTLKRISGSTAYVGYPNKEVRTAMAQLYTEQLLAGLTIEQAGGENIPLILAEENAQSVFHLLKRLFASIDYLSYPAKEESSVRAFVQILFTGAGLEPRVEVHNNKGRSDLEVRVGNRHWVFEFKYCREGENSEKLLQGAVEQIQSRHYGEHSSTGELIRMALVFSEKERQFVKWSEV